MNKEKLCPMKRESLSDEQLAAVQGGDNSPPVAPPPATPPMQMICRVHDGTAWNEVTVLIKDGVCDHKGQFPQCGVCQIRVPW